jgi:hypothetical protein
MDRLKSLSFNKMALMNCAAGKSSLPWHHFHQDGVSSSINLDCWCQEELFVSQSIHAPSSRGDIAQFSLVFVSTTSAIIQGPELLPKLLSLAAYSVVWSFLGFEA